MNGPGKAEGWYPDPSDPNQLRWWNSVEWTDHTQPAPAAPAPPVRRFAKPAPPTRPRSSDGTPPPPARPVSINPPPPDSNDTGTKKGWAIALAVAALIVVAIVGSALSDDPDDTTLARPETSASTPTTDSSADSDTTTPSQPTTTSPSDTTGATSSQQPADTETATERLAELVVAQLTTPPSPYIRDQYQPGGWSDFDNDCQSTRHEVLQARSNERVVMSADGCRVSEGLWIDSFNGDRLTTAEEATIDHLVPLAEAHRSGGWQWDQATKERFANDDTAINFRIVGSDINQAKADSRPDQWLPPDEASHCAYAVDWIAVKHRWQLTVTASESAKLADILEGCPAGDSVQPFTSAPPVIVTTTVAPSTTVAIPESAGPGVLTLVSCDRYSERVVIANTGGEPVSLSGYNLHDEGFKHTHTLGQYGTLEAGETITIISGEDAAADADTNTHVWKRSHVWNNDGDIAHLVTPAGTTTTAGC